MFSQNFNSLSFTQREKLPLSFEKMPSLFRTFTGFAKFCISNIPMTRLITILEKPKNFYQIKKGNVALVESSIIIEVIRPVLNFLFYFYDKISQVQKSIFFYQYRLKVDLVLYTYVFIYLKATIKKIWVLILLWI